ncbi:MAG: PspC domain-containing protein [Bacteroidales bacterium]|nr:PspC domain-containing protein [Bacteroidales bacterium]
MADKKLTRLAADKKLGGVCSGLAKYFGMDATIVRLGYALVTLCTGLIPCLLVYVIAMFIVPEE